MATLQIDGSQGEGGGQVLRTSLALSLALGIPVALTHIRAGRAKPGLLRQHLTCVRAACALTGQECTAALGDTELVFEPGPVAPGSYAFDIGSAGSTALIVQTLLMPLLLTGAPSDVRVTGGTHAASAPPIDALSMSFLPLLAALGADVELDLVSAGFMPAGGGHISLRVNSHGASKGLKATKPLELIERGAAAPPGLHVHTAHLPASVALREQDVLAHHFGCTPEEVQVHDHPGSPCPGNAVVIAAPFAFHTEVFSALGRKRLSAERVANKAHAHYAEYQSRDAPVGEHLADQLLVPLCLGAGGVFRCTAQTPHLQTNAAVINQFLPGAVRIARDGIVEVAPLPSSN